MCGHAKLFFGDSMRFFFIVLARDSHLIRKKIDELDDLGFPYIIVSGEPVNNPNVVYREPKGKFDAINFGLTFIPKDTDFVVFNDVDTEIHNFKAAIDLIQNDDPSLIFMKVQVQDGPQLAFYSLLDTLRKKIPIAASGELLVIKHALLKSISPLQRCKAEDSYILFKVLEKKEKTSFCEKCYVTTKRTMRAEEEEQYKRRTVGGIYQALSMTNPPLLVKFFYAMLPLISPLLVASGRKGYYWTKGILLGFIDFVRNDKSGTWKPTYS